MKNTLKKLEEIEKNENMVIHEHNLLLKELITDLTERIEVLEDKVDELNFIVNE